MRARHAKVTRDSKPECSGLLKFSAIAAKQALWPSVGVAQAARPDLGPASASADSVRKALAGALAFGRRRSSH